MDKTKQDKNPRVYSITLTDQLLEKIIPEDDYAIFIEDRLSTLRKFKLMKYSIYETFDLWMNSY